MERTVLPNRFVNEKSVAIYRSIVPETGFRFFLFTLNIFIIECEKCGFFDVTKYMPLHSYFGISLAFYLSIRKRHERRFLNMVISRLIRIL